MPAPDKILQLVDHLASNSLSKDTAFLIFTMLLLYSELQCVYTSVFQLLMETINKEEVSPGLSGGLWSKLDELVIETRLLRNDFYKKAEYLIQRR